MLWAFCFLSVVEETEIGLLSVYPCVVVAGKIRRLRGAKADEWSTEDEVGVGKSSMRWKTSGVK